MLRMFATHEIRPQKELSSCLWEFATMPEDGKEPVRRKAMVPGCWESCPDTRTYRGKACYERDFEAAGNIRLEFKGVSHTAEVYVDGEQVAFHYNAYTPFSTVVKGLAPGTHRLKVCVDNSFNSSSALHVENDYQTYGGITRAVALEELKNIYVTRLHVTPVKEDGCWHARVEACVRNLEQQAFSGQLRLTVASAGKAEASAVCPFETAGGEEAALHAEIACGDAAEWSPERPVLYTVSAVVEDRTGEAVDDLIDRFGFREVQVAGRDILMNGKKLQIRGFCRHEDHPQFGCALPLAAMQQDLLLMRDMGANSVRTSHYPNVMSSSWTSVTRRACWCGRRTMPGGCRRRPCGIRISRGSARTASGR